MAMVTMDQILIGIIIIQDGKYTIEIYNEKVNSLKIFIENELLEKPFGLQEKISRGKSGSWILGS